MTLAVDSPWIASARAEGVPDAVLADWLYDQGATAADLALLLAGTPPGHVDGITRECLALWLERHGRVEQARAVRAEPPAGWWQDTEAQGWAPAQQFWYFSAPGYAHDPKDEPGVYVAVWHDRDYWFWRSYVGRASGRSESREKAFAAAADATDLTGYARRNLLRRLLSLPWAARVRVTYTHVSAHDPDGAPFEAVIRADLDAEMRPGVCPVYSLGRDADGNPRWRAEQTLTAPQLVWPETAPEVP